VNKREKERSLDVLQDPVLRKLKAASKELLTNDLLSSGENREAAPRR